MKRFDCKQVAKELKSEDIERTLTLAEAASEKGCSEETLRRAIRSGRLRAHKEGRAYVIAGWEFERFRMRDEGYGIWWRVDRIAEASGRDESAVLKDIADGVLHAQKFGGRWIVLKEEAEAYITAMSAVGSVPDEFWTWVDDAYDELGNLRSRLGPEDEGLAQRIDKLLNQPVLPWVRVLKQKLTPRSLWDNLTQQPSSAISEEVEELGQDREAELREWLRERELRRKMFRGGRETSPQTSAS